MEKQLNDTAIFANYQNRQVILNYYQDEDFLYKREVFHFLIIKVTDSTLTFLKKDNTFITIDLTEYPMVSMNADFQNYFILRNNLDKLEIYFP
ncbi:hypothetical protein V7111_06200 [Neobacillus niacini]|uniref:hypothetical protein n=1 Tax=Neobacillus niacini TaxID=86668 RepID=UPI0030005B32